MNFKQSLIAFYDAGFSLLDIRVADAIYCRQPNMKEKTFNHVCSLVREAYLDCSSVSLDHVVDVLFSLKESGVPFRKITLQVLFKIL